MGEGTYCHELERIVTRQGGWSLFGPLAPSTQESTVLRGSIAFLLSDTRGLKVSRVQAMLF